MRGVRASCPACGGPVLFKISSSLVTVCEHCSSVVARQDRKLEDLGKVAAIVETDSPLHLGLKGKFRGKSFELVGRTQYRHSAGGTWDEWYAAFSNGKWGWLAEAQGRFYLTFARKPSEESSLPRFEELEVGRTFEFEGLGAFTVGEIGEARALAAEGEIPFRFEPNSAYSFADLYGSGGEFATFDYSDDEPRAYIGHVVSLNDLGIAERVVAPDREPRDVAALKVDCPQCGGPLTLHAPDETLRVCCPNCGSLLDADKGNLRYLKTLDFGKLNPLIPIGATGILFGTTYTAIGLLRRSVTEEGQDYFWSEYLLYNSREGFRWLIQNDSHWSFAEPISPGEVVVGHLDATYRGRRFKIFQRGIAEVRYVLGECYWKVEIGEEASTSDFIAPPEMLSVEYTVPRNMGTGQQEGDVTNRVQRTAGEVNMSLATYVPRETVAAAFQVPGLPASWKIAPNQPFPVDRRIYPMWGIFLAVLVAMNVVFSAGLVKGGVDQFFFFTTLVMISAIPGGSLIYRLFFERSRWADSPYNPYFVESDDNDDDDGD